jgi:superfamily II DNA or RNA helicase
MLTYRNDIDGEKGMLFNRMKWWKQNDEMQKYHAAIARIKKLDATEFVCLYKDKHFPTGLLNLVVEALKSFGATYQIVDGREVPKPDALLRWQNKPWAPRYYQQNMIDLGLQQGRGVFQSAVGTGKSLIMGYLIKELSVNSLIIAPSRGLSFQLGNDLASWFGDRNVDLLDASKVRKLKRVKPISIITVQSCASLIKTGEFQKFAQEMGALHVDEIHHAGAATYTNLLPSIEHIYHRFGYSGTFLRNDNKTLEMWGFLSNVLYDYPAHQAIKEGYLTPMEVLIHKLGGKRSKNYQKEYEGNYCGNPDMLKRIHEICMIDPNAQVLVLVKQKDKSGKIIHEYLNTLGVSNAYISGDNTSEQIDATITAFNEKKVRVMIGSSVIGEGIDVRSTDHLIMAQGGKSEVVMVQAAGRLIRLYEGKQLGWLHDFQFTGTEYMEGHLDDRIDTYKNNFACPIRYAE